MNKVKIILTSDIFVTYPTFLPVFKNMKKIINNSNWTFFQKWIYFLWYPKMTVADKINPTTRERLRFLYPKHLLIENSPNIILIFYMHALINSTCFARILSIKFYRFNYMYIYHKGGRFLKKILPFEWMAWFYWSYKSQRKKPRPSPILQNWAPGQNNLYQYVEFSYAHWDYCYITNTKIVSFIWFYKMNEIFGFMLSVTYMLENWF